MCTNEPYGFIYCDLRNMKLYKNFTTLLWSKIDDLKNNKDKKVCMDKDEFVKEHNLNHSYALLNEPDVLNVKYSNSNTLPFKDVMPGQVAVDINNQYEIDSFLKEQNKLRGLK